MAKYDYKCGSCNTVIEVSHSMADNPVVLCGCGTPRHRVPQITGTVLKGNGWYSKPDHRTEQ